MKQPSAADDELGGHLRILEARIDEAVVIIERLRHENDDLRVTLEESRRQRAEASRKLLAVLDRIDTLL